MTLGELLERDMIHSLLVRIDPRFGKESGITNGVHNRVSHMGFIVVNPLYGFTHDLLDNMIDDISNDVRL